MAHERAVHEAKQILAFHEHVLLGLRGLYNASKSVERNEFAKFYYSTIKSRPEGIIGLGYISNVPAKELDQFIKDTQADESPWFRIQFKPSQKEKAYWVTTYHEPENVNILGLVALAFLPLKVAIERSVKNNFACVSQPVHLSPELSNLQFLVTPVWKKSGVDEDGADQEKVMGWVYSLIDLGQMFEDVGRHQDRIVAAKVELVETTKEVKSLLPGPNQSTFDYLGQNWLVTLDFAPQEKELGTLLTLHIGVGIILSLLLSLLLASILSSRQRAQRIADEKTLFLDKSQSVAHVGSWSYDIASRELSWSDESYRIHELPIGTALNPEEAIGRYVGESQKRIGQAIEECVSKGSPFEGEFQLKTQSGRMIWVWKAGAPLTNEPNCPTICGIIQDITEKKELEESLQEERKIAMHASKLSSLGEMAGGIAHEINNPLTVIVMAATKIRHLVEAKNTTE
ncbi:MAG: CHASE domain-containing protein, partial [Bdellovibrionales bacterium]|nr:CHASE domain-containing protein [Bdellovibrionales bacterium]